MGQAQVHAEARHQQDEALRHRDRLLVTGGVGPADVHGAAAQIAPEAFHDGHQVGQNLEGVVDVALHIEHRRAAGRGHVADVLVANVPVALTDSDAVAVATDDFTDLFRRVAMADLRGLALNELGVTAQLGHAGLEADARARTGEEEEHGQHLVAQQGVIFAGRAATLQIPGNIQQRINFVTRPLLGGDHVAPAQIRLHCFLPTLCR